MVFCTQSIPVTMVIIIIQQMRLMGNSLEKNTFLCKSDKRKCDKRQMKAEGEKCILDPSQWRCLERVLSLEGPQSAAVLLCFGPVEGNEESNGPDPARRTYSNPTVRKQVDDVFKDVSRNHTKVFYTGFQKRLTRDKGADNTLESFGCQKKDLRFIIRDQRQIHLQVISKSVKGDIILLEEKPNGRKYIEKTSAGPGFEPRGHGEDLKYCDWKEQITGLLGTQELAEPRKVDIVLGALAGEAKRQVSVLEEKEKDQVRKILNYLDSLYGDRTPTAVLRLRRHDPDDSPSDIALRDQLLLGLQEGPLAQALKVYARRNPEGDFAAIRQEALLLDAEYGNTPTEATWTWLEGGPKEGAKCFTASFKLTIPAAEVRGAGVADSPPEGKGATEMFVGQSPTIGVTIEGVQLQGLLDTGSQVTLMQQSLLEKYFTGIKPEKTPVFFQLRAANGLEIPYTGYAVLDFEVEGISIPGRGVIIVMDEHCTHPLIIGMNIVTACWKALFKSSAAAAPCPSPIKHQKAWKDAFATCRRIEATVAEDGLLGFVRLARRGPIRIPPRSEMLVWGRARRGPRGADYCALLDPTSETSKVGVARTLAIVRNGRIPVRVCNPHPYSLSIGRYEKLGKLYHMDETDVHGPRDLSLSLEEDGAVEVALVDAAVPTEQSELPQRVRDLTNRPDLSEAQQEELCALLQKWEKVFAKHDEDFGRTEAVKHQIHTGGAAPIRERYRPLPPLMYREVKSLLSDMLERGVIRESCSPWAAPIVPVKKKDNSWRFCVDYRKLNAVTHKDAFPLPRIEETLTSLNRAEWFSTLDLASGYWQVEMDPQDREKTAFTTPLGLFEFERMPFGLCNAPATFQRLMQQCLSGQMAESLLVYLDDIIIYSPDFSSHLQHLDGVLQRLWQHGLKLRLDKCKLLQRETARLGATEQRWVAQLASFNYSIKYRPGKSNTNADALSRFPVPTSDDEPSDAEAAFSAAVELAPDGGSEDWADGEWELAQANDPDIRLVKEYVDRQTRPSRAERQAMSRTAQKLLQQQKRLVNKGNLLCRRVIEPRTNEEHYQIVCPSSRHREVWMRIHEAAAHAGVDRTLARVRQKFYWPDQEGEVRRYHQGCVACSLQREKVELRAPLNPVVVSYPLEVIGLDFLSLGRPTDVFQNILVATDLFTRFAWAIPTRDQTAQTTVRALWTHVIQPFGCPAHFHSDQGPNFESALMKQLCDTYGVTKSRTTPYHPAGNGGTERFNQTLLDMLRSLETAKQNRWPEYISELVHAYNNTTHSSTGYAPSFLMFGRHLRLPVDLELGVGPQEVRHELSGWVNEHQRRLSTAYNIAGQKMSKAASQSKQHYDKKAKAMPLLPGERVWVRERNRQGRGKLCTWWGNDPFVILDKVGETGVVYRVQPEKGGRQQTVHRNALKPCTAPPVDILPPVAEPEAGSQRLLETLKWPEPLFYGFFPLAPHGAPQDGPQEAVRRSARPNFGKPPDRYGD
nr:uncharacterized protein LOC129165457 [Nothobranchius furzeri]